MKDKELRRKVLLPVFQLTEVCEPDDVGSQKRAIKQGVGRDALTYYYRSVVDDQSSAGLNYNRFPVILDRKGAPWSLGMLFILARLEGELTPNMVTFHALADDLGAFKEWLDQHDDPDDLLCHFPQLKVRRTTYRYRGFIKQKIDAQELSANTGKRRMGTVIGFYEWLVETGFLSPAHPLWEEKHYQLHFKNAVGVQLSKSVMGTDLNISAAKSDDPWAGTIQDGGKLRPLTGVEQQWILEAAYTKGNTEAYLLQLFMLATGARIQTACTLRVQHFSQDAPKFSKSFGDGGEVFKCQVSCDHVPRRSMPLFRAKVVLDELIAGFPPRSPTHCSTSPERSTA